MSKKQEQPEGGFPVGMGQPALRALTNAGITQLEQLTTFSEAEIKKLHGMGPNGINKLRDALAAKGLAFDEAKPKKR